jgi:hypothetical protein
MDAGSMGAVLAAWALETTGSETTEV